jgi:hypothetical protein
MEKPKQIDFYLIEEKLLEFRISRKCEPSRIIINHETFKKIFNSEPMFKNGITLQGTEFKLINCFGIRVIRTNNLLDNEIEIY